MSHQDLVAPSQLCVRFLKDDKNAEVAPLD